MGCGIRGLAGFTTGLTIFDRLFHIVWVKSNGKQDKSKCDDEATLRIDSPISQFLDTFAAQSIFRAPPTLTGTSQ